MWCRETWSPRDETFAVCGVRCAVRGDEEYFHVSTQICSDLAGNLEIRELGRLGRLG